MKVIPKISFVERDSSTGKLTSYAVGVIYEVDDILGHYYIEEGLAVNAPSGGDFTIAKVEIETLDSISLAYLADLYGEPYIVNVDINGDGIYNVPLYKGSAVGVIALTENHNVTVTGDIQWIGNDSILIVTGDGTIKVAGGK